MGTHENKPNTYQHTHRMIYKSRNKPPEVGRGLFSWWRPLASVSEDEILRLCGVDALVLLRFYKLGMQMFVSNGLVALIVLLPIYVFGTSRRLCCVMP